MSRVIKLLNLEMQKKCGIFLCNALDVNLNVFVTHTLRTFEVQDNLFMIGRFGDDRKIVTRALGGWSIHNYRDAFDVGLRTVQGNLLWDVSKDLDNDGIPEWEEVGDCVRDITGLAWAGDWTSFKELCHIQSSTLALEEAQKSWFVDLVHYISKSQLYDFHIQKYMKKMGLYTGKLDGIIGLMSKAAIKELGGEYEKNNKALVMCLLMEYFTALGV